MLKKLHLAWSNIKEEHWVFSPLAFTMHIKIIRILLNTCKYTSPRETIKIRMKKKQYICCNAFQFLRDYLQVWIVYSLYKRIISDKRGLEFEAAGFVGKVKIKTLEGKLMLVRYSLWFWLQISCKYKRGKTPHNFLWVKVLLANFSI